MLDHRRVCLPPGTDTSALTWTDRCRCGHMRCKHQAFSHPKLDVPGGTCTGRNDAGECSLCDCPEFTLEET